MKPVYRLLFILLSWLALSPCSCFPILDHNRSNNIQCINTERNALLQFKHGITNDTCGLLTSWGSQTDCCQWSGVVCSNLTGHVITLSLPGDPMHYGYACLQGKVSSSLGELKHLKHLNLSRNIFYGEIPHQLGNLSKLTTLDLRFSYNAGVPVENLSWISRLTLLRYLDLSYANLSQVTNWITIVNSLPSLCVLSMNICELPLEIQSSLSYVNSSATLHTISLSGNYFKDYSIFQWLFNLPKITTQLVHLDLSWNAIQVPIPSEIGNLHSLSYLDLSHNAFQGSVLKVISNLCNLEQLQLWHNNFTTDELSNVIHSLVKCNNKTLSVLDLSFNRFRGGIPDDIGLLSSLRELYLNGNQLNGELSSGIGQLTMLEILDVSSNSLEGTLTRTIFSSLVRLRELRLSDNLGLEISIEEDWIPPFKLDVILLRSCKLGPRFPKWLQLQTNFTLFDVSNTSIYDSIPISFWNSLSSNLQYLNMSYNKFYGMLHNVPYIYKAYTIDLSSNLFEGVVPSGFAVTWYLYLNDNRFSNCSSLLCSKSGIFLEKLDLSNNLFSGELPDCWMNFSYLTSLHLENNELSGRLPNSIGTLLNLQYLDLHNNSFSGPLFPVAFESLTSLAILNLGYNLFSGNIPPWIGNAAFQSLGALILRENHFIGEIPKSICKLNHLQILDLANNHLSGVIPNCFGNFTAMKGIENVGLNVTPYVTFYNIHDFESEGETTTVSWKRKEQKFKQTIRFVKYINLSGNELRGKIPKGISILNGLESLDLSKNKLSGKIPFEIGNLTALELLYLSNNHLTGEIPASLAKVTTLGIVNVSNNNLSGEIPISTQLQSFNASSYAGNKGLCGAPLPSCSKDGTPSHVPSGDKTSVQNKDDDDFVFFLGLYISVALGLVVGFWGVCGTLVIKASRRHAYLFPAP